MIQVILTRDQARCVQANFFFYIGEYCQMKKSDATGDDEKKQWYLVTDLFNQVKRIFDKKLLTIPNKLKFSFTDSQGIIFHQLLMILPMDPEKIYLVTLRQKICNDIHLEISKIFVRDQIFK